MGCGMSSALRLVGVAWPLDRPSAKNFFRVGGRVLRTSDPRNVSWPALGEGSVHGGEWGDDNVLKSNHCTEVF